jgi:holo-[acyl-carrier protein] synthase
VCPESGEEIRVVPLHGRSETSVMIVGTGVDIAETSRIEQALERHGERFCKRIYTAREMEYCEQFKNKAERYAARFAAKEAAFKALGTGWRNGVRWLDVEITHQPSGKPELALTGRAEEVARRLGVTRTAVSLSHSDRYVVAQVIFESDG